MNEDQELLRRYSVERSQEAFAELVRRHIGAVYHSLLRQLNGDILAAEDACQVVFAELAQRAAALASMPLLVGWLHTRARYAALQHLRTERRRRAREQEAFLMQEIMREGEGSADWQRVRPEIDAALQSLSALDREAVLLRYFEDRPFAEVGARLNLSADAARSRVERALEKLQPFLRRRGIASTGAALSVALTGHAAGTAPAGLAASVSGAVLAGSASTAGSSALVSGGITLMKTTTLALAVSLAANLILGLQFTSRAAVVAPAVAGGPVLPAKAAAVPSPLAYSPDPARLLANLTAANVSPRVRRALVLAAIDAQFRAREQAILPGKSGVGWWQWEETRIPMDVSLALLDLRREKARLAQRLLGPDPDTAMAAADDPIPPEKRALLRLISDDYSTMLAPLRLGALLPAERQQVQLVEAERLKDLAALLTPEELAAYNERTWIELPLVQWNLRFFDATDAEFGVLLAMRKDQVASYQADSMTADQSAADEVKLRNGLGAERFDVYEASRVPELRDLQALLDRNGMARDLIKPAFAAWLNIETESHRIAKDATLTREQGQAALKDLAARTRVEFLRVLGPSAGPPLVKRMEGLLGTLERGGTVTFTEGGWGGGPLGFPLLPSLRIPGETK